MVQGPAAERKFSRGIIRQNILIPIAVVVVLILAAAGWHVISSVNQARKEDLRNAMNERAGALAQEVAEPFETLSGQLRKLAKSPDIVELFKQGDAVQLAAATDNYIDRFDSALKLRFFLPHGYTLDDSSIPPLSYASLDMLRKAEQSNENSGMEVHLFGSPRQHIVMVQRVEDGKGELIGLIHLSLDVSLIEKALSRLKLTNDYVELKQSATTYLGKAGDPAYKSGQPIVVTVPGSSWNVSYWGNGKKVAVKSGGGGNQFTVIAGSLAGLLVLGLAVVYLKKRFSSATTVQPKSEVVYAGAVRAIMDGAHPGMERLVPDLPEGSTPASDVEPVVGQGIIDDDVTLMVGNVDPQTGDADILDLTQEPGQGEKKQTPPQVSEKAGTQAPAKQDQAQPARISPVIFRAYDIRGIVGKTLTTEAVNLIGRAIGSEAGDRGQQTVIVGRDGRNSSPELAEALIKGLTGSGRDVIDIGVVPTPVLYFATHALDVHSGVMVTGSHNGPAYNGLKIVLAGETLSEESLQKLHQRIKDKDLSGGQGAVSSADVVADYVRRISEDIPVALGTAFKVIVDCGNGVAGMVAPQLIRALGHDVIELYCEVDGKFPNHHPDPSQPENLQDLIARVKEDGADIGLAFDGDGDRLGVVDGNGKIIWPDRQLMALARDVLSRNPGAEIIYDVKCSRHLKSLIESSGGKALMWKTGHSLIKNKMKEVNAPLAGEMSGHIFFKERWYGFDDAMYTAARLLEVLMNAGKKPAEFFAELPEDVSTPELRIDLPEEAHRTIMQDLEAKAAFDGAEIIKTDGLRIEFPDGWGLIRPSNTTPCLVLRFEAENEEALSRIQETFRTMLQAVNPDLQLPF